MIAASLKYQLAPAEYFLFGFYNKNAGERKLWAGTTAMWQAQRQFVPKSLVPIFANKARFRHVFHKLMDYSELTVTKDVTEEKVFGWLQHSQANDVFIKPTTGQCGDGAKRINNTDTAKLANEIKRHCVEGVYTVQTCLVNHESLQKVAPNSLNTIRVVTKVNSNGNAHILFARVRFGLDSEVDNLAAGGLAAGVDRDTGEIVTDAIVTTTIISPNRGIHPVSGTQIKGLQIPYWNDVIELSKKAALVCPQAKVIGWDIAVTPDGPVLLEGNHNWCKNLWQLPVGEGKRKELNKLVYELSS